MQPSKSYLHRVIHIVLVGLILVTAGVALSSRPRVFSTPQMMDQPLLEGR